MGLIMDRPYKGVVIVDAYHKVFLDGPADDLQVVVRIFNNKAASTDVNNTLLVGSRRMNAGTTPVDLDGENTHKQAYEFLKTLDEYEDAVDLL